MTDHFVFCQNYPPSTPHFTKPVFVLGIRREIVVVDFHLHARLPKRISDLTFSEGAIEEENGRLRRPRLGAHT